MDHEEIKRRVIAAIAALFDNDEVLLRINASERAIAHRLALFLTDEFPKWDVDCEYNRDGHDHPKLMSELDYLKESSEDSVFPDIIIHRRTRRYFENNLLVIEMKKSTKTQGKTLDHRKLSIFTTDLHSQEMNYHYQMGLFLQLRAWRRLPSQGQLKAIGVWYREGKPTNEKPVELQNTRFDYRK